MNKSSISIVSLAALAALAALEGTATAATPTTWVSNYDINSAQTTIKFNDWGYTPIAGVNANTYQIGPGFDSSRIGQIQHVVTTGPDGITPDPGHTVYQDFNEQNPPFTNANMDSAVNFYKWGYTTVAGSTFNNMQIDKAGNYHVAQNDMKFQFYDSFKYSDKTGANPNSTYDTSINFQPYAVSDAKGWCGSVMSSNPDSLEKMAGQVTFDFAFDAYLSNNFQGGGPGVTGNPNSAIQIVPGFVMRSYGDYEVSYTEDGYSTTYYGSAVANNINPVTGLPDPAYHDKVSFLGAGVVPNGVWIKINQIRPDGSWDYSVAATQGADGTVDGEARSDGTVWHFNAFGGYAFLMRADGMRILDYVNPTGHSDYVTTTSAVPLPAAAWLLGSGLFGLFGVTRNRKQVF
ncbi:VPLPA-CTERM sorting domain-containing protein [Sulfurirhabdus autotrophica]|uniref:Putative secreted protein n=1 Tax=Sulfurirhabdus autotrophica TaxID=1706046 RepID=A0A4R3XVU1_9PROT|nr:VPLPA-CTERM sorting domain-containing protein [Sulfurirhabdus autotrophica]TCV83396.1 putative secreted protein [Sulfurirhabdus autotrophica]